MIIQPCNNYIVRKVEEDDYEKLQTFFKKAYGESTIFQSKKFLDWYFNPKYNSPYFMPDCLVGVSDSGEIVSHYGGLKYNLILNGKVYPIVWGVNAFTYPEWRGKGINSQIVEYLVQNNTINGVIGFTKKTATFYNSLNYNIFQYNRFSRFYRVLDYKKTLEVVNFLGKNPNVLKEISLKPKPSNSNIITINNNNINDYNIEFNVDVDATTERTREFIIWRFLNNPVINYHCFGLINKNKITSYIVCRIEQLEPMSHNAARIIDMFGTKKEVGELLKKLYEFVIKRDCIYIEFSVFGDLYNETLINAGFLELKEEDYAILPQTCSPITKRDNNEYIGLQSIELNNEISKLNIESVYFTRMDSDRDRASRITQTKQK